MRLLKIKTSRTAAGFSAHLADDPVTKATSTSSDYTAAENLAIRLFVGHNNRAQIREEVLSRIVVKRASGSTFHATFDN